jgi:hypothetical protein
LRVVLRKVFFGFRFCHASTICEPSMARIQGMILKAKIRFSKKDDVQHESVQQHSGDWAMTGKVPVARVEGQRPLPATIGRVKAIQHIKTMAGSPDADRIVAVSVRQSCAWFYVLDLRAFRETMKEDRNVQYSFSRDRLGWASPQA